MVILGIILLVLGLLLPAYSVLVTIGIVLLVIGLILNFVPFGGGNHRVF